MNSPIARNARITGGEVVPREDGKSKLCVDDTGVCVGSYWTVEYETGPPKFGERLYASIVRLHPGGDGPRTDEGFRAFESQADKIMTSANGQSDD